MIMKVINALIETRRAIESGEIATAIELERFLLDYEPILLNAERARIFREFSNQVVWESH